MVTVNKGSLIFYFTVSSFRWFLHWYAWWRLQKGSKHAAYM